MKVLLFAGSLRKDSYNKKLVVVANQLLQDSNIETTVVDLQPLQFPVYDGDIEASGIPQNVQMLSQFVSEADAIIISSPEYNGSISSPLKNTIDWLSRTKPLNLSKKQILLLGASPGELGAMRGLLHSKMPFEALGNFVYPRVYGLPKADQAFGENNKLNDTKRQETLAKLITEFIEHCKNFK